MKWFADNSELNGIKETQIPDILMFGGIAVPANIEHELRSRIEDIKGRYAHIRKFPTPDLIKLLTAILFNQRPNILAILHPDSKLHLNFSLHCHPTRKVDEVVCPPS